MQIRLEKTKRKNGLHSYDLALCKNGKNLRFDSFAHAKQEAMQMARKLAKHFNRPLKDCTRPLAAKIARVRR